MTITREDAERFFAEYAVALAGRDPAAIARFWGVPGLVLSDGGANPVDSTATVEQFFAGSMAQYEEVTAAQATIVQMIDLSDAVAGYDIEWAHRDAGGARIGCERGYYVLRRGEAGLRVYVYVPRLS